MKRLSIYRPSGLSGLRRRFNFSFPFDFANWDNKAFSRLVAMYRTMEDSVDRDVLSALFLLRESRTQFFVEAELSRQLELSSVVGDVGALVWPSEAIHVVFEDPDLPEVLVSKRTVLDPEVNRWGPGISVIASNCDGLFDSILIPNSHWARFAKGGWSPRWHKVDSPNLSSQELENMRYLSSLFAKVLAYSCVPYVRHVEPKSKAERKELGIHPNRYFGGKLVSLRSLPRVKVDCGGDLGVLTSAKHRFFGRAGHIRLYQSDRYKNWKGKWQWIPPIPPPEGAEVVYRVSRVQAGAVPIRQTQTQNRKVDEYTHVSEMS